ncbi:hypothetical protein ACL03H_17300 [Saccharopolyspora sp. MS10]|uniref:hypothetical protein n=1 Tax=Saccharopolyspora sp. MS10 TaxID=3385973 RepID=UPI0039A1FB87
MTSQRPFRPAFVRAIGSHFVSIDHVQPVAISISSSGELIGSTSWADQASPVATKKRIVTSDEGRVFVIDWPTSLAAPNSQSNPISVVAVAVSPNGNLTSAAADESEVPSSPRTHRRMSSRGATHTIEASEQHWIFRNHLTGWIWNSEAIHAGAHLALPSPAHITSHATLGDLAAITVQRENKRPWPFQPQSEVQILTRTRSALTSMGVPHIDIGHLCWARRRDEREALRDLNEYMRFTRSQIHSAAKKGARDVRLVVRGAGLDTTIELWFTLDSAPGAVFCRRDVPFDETGHASGLRGQNIALDEDIESGLIQIASHDEGSVTYI